MKDENKLRKLKNLHIIEVTSELKYEATTDIWIGITKKELIQYYKLKGTKKEFENTIINKFRELPEKIDKKIAEGEEIEGANIFKSCVSKVEILLDMWEDIPPITFKEAFEIKNNAFQILVFELLDVKELIEGMGYTTIDVGGKEVTHKTFDYEGNFTGMKDYHVVYELLEVDGTKFSTNKLYVVKCWCTTTNEEHYLWVNKPEDNSALTAIASTAVFHESVIPYIKEIKRQGDVFITEYDKDIEELKDLISYNPKKRSLTADEYFGLLTAQS